MTHAAFLLASGNLRATEDQSKPKRLTANSKWRARRDENLGSVKDATARIAAHSIQKSGRSGWHDTDYSVCNRGNIGTCIRNTLGTMKLDDWFTRLVTVPTRSFSACQTA